MTTDEEGSVVLRAEWLIYRIDTRIVDVHDFFLRVFASPDITIVWYDLKVDIKRLGLTKNPLQEGQGKLF
jgi:hypothetical protein